MRKIILPVILTIIFANCQTLKYDFRENISNYSDIQRLNSKILSNLTNQTGSLSGILTLKNNTFKYIISYNIIDKFIEIKLFDLNGENSILKAVYNDTSISVDTLNSGFQYNDGYTLIKLLSFSLLQEYNRPQYYYTRDDYLVIVDKDNNYYKYDSDLRIIKKENFITSSIFEYNSRGIRSITISYLGQKYIFITDEQ